MPMLKGLQEYLVNNYESSVFDLALASDADWEFYLHGGQYCRANLMENLVYDVKLRTADGVENLVPKVTIKCCFPSNQADAVGRLIKIDKKVRAMKLEPIYAPHLRYFVKNKTLFPLMLEKTVVFTTLLEGEVIRGLVTDFSRYDLTISLKGGLPVTILRHSIYDMRDKRGRCYLKANQEEARDWQKSALYISA
jgi:hypothetical protein